MWPDEVRERATAADLCEWAVYLNSPFSVRGRDMMQNGWLVHTIKSIVADRKHRPKFADSMFPFDKLYKEFFAKPASSGGGTKQAGGLKRPPKSVGEVLHGTHVLRKNYERAMADYRAGRTTNRFGLKYGERLKC